MAGRLANKVAVITGGTKGIGRATVEAFVREGAKVVFCGRDLDAAKEVEAAVNDQSGNAKNARNAIFVKCDVTVFDEVERVVKTAVEEFGRLDVLFNNAGTGTFGETPDVEIDEWKRMLDIDLTGTFYGCKVAIPLMKQSGGGVIVNNASMSGLFGEYGLSAYTAAKAGVINYTRTLALDHGKDRIRAVAVCPGFIDTAATSFYMDQPDLLARIVERVPVARPGQPEDIAMAVVYLSSDEAAFITGTTLVLDGGMTASTNLPNLQ